MKKLIAGVGAFVCATAMVSTVLVPGAWATNGYQLIGVGQMQKSMAGAVTAAPMDTMTAITNPAGMARVGNRADFSMEAFMPQRSVGFGAWGGTAKEEGGTELYGVPSVGWVADAFNRDNMVFGGGMFATSGLGVDFGESTLMPAAALTGFLSMSPPPNFGTFTAQDVTFDGYSAIQFWKMAPTVAWDVDDKSSVGVSLNVDYQSVTIRQKFGNMPFFDLGTGNIQQMDVNFDLGRPTSQLGVGVTLGVLRDLSDMVTLGATYSSRQYFAAGQYRVGTDDIKTYNGATGAPGTYELGLDYPQQAAVGVAVKPNDRLLVDLDVKWINWSTTHDAVTLTGPAGAFMTPGGPTNSTQLEFGWKDQMVYALGVQWAASDQLTLRGGYNYAKAPIDEKDVMNNLIFPALVEHHVAFGGDYQLGEHWGIGAAFMKAFKKDLRGTGDVPVGFQQPNTPFSADSNFDTSLQETSFGLLLYYLM